MSSHITSYEKCSTWKDLGGVQDSEFYIDSSNDIIDKATKEKDKKIEYIASPTAEEWSKIIGKHYPELSVMVFEDGSVTVTPIQRKRCRVVTERILLNEELANCKVAMLDKHNEKLTDAFADMAIYLKSNNII